MPYKDIEKRRAYDRERKRRKRAEQKAREEAEQIERGNINYSASRPKAEQFMSFEEYKRQNPRASFREYLDKKIKFQQEHRVHSVPKISREQAIKIEGFDMWHGHEKKAEEIEEHHRQADALEQLLSEPEHPNRPKERYNWQADLEEEIAKLNQKMKSEKEDEKSEN